MKRHALTTRQIEAVRLSTLGSNGKPLTQLTDGMGLYLKLQWGLDGQPSGKGHQWRFDYTRPTTGRRNTLSFGAFPTVSLQLARERADEARAIVAAGSDPAELRKQAKAGVTAGSVRPRPVGPTKQERRLQERKAYWADYDRFRQHGLELLAMVRRLIDSNDGHGRIKSDDIAAAVELLRRFN